MRRAIPMLAATAVLACAIADAPARTRYDLAKVPRFRPGDRMAVRETNQKVMTVTDKNGRAQRNEKEITREHHVNEVLTVDASGKVTAIRARIVSATRSGWTMADRPRPDKVITIANLYAAARRVGLFFEADTASIAAAGAKPLTASQIWLVKDIFDDEMVFRAYPEAMAMLMPARPVPVGHVWQPSRETLDRFANTSRSIRKIQGKVTRAELRLASVTRGVAEVRGTVHLLGRIRQTALSPVVSLTARIDTTSGVWVGFDRSVMIKQASRGGTVQFAMSSRGTGTFVRGTGAGSKLPAKLHKIGWAKPGKDANRFQHPAAGLSMDVPADYKPREVPPNGRTVAQFNSPEGASVSISQTKMSRPYDVEEFAPSVIAGLKRNIKDYRLLSRDPVTLTGNIPAVLIVGTTHGGKAWLLSLSAFDGKRLVQVTAGVPSDKPKLLPVMQRLVRTLRLSEPDPNRGK